MVNYLLKVIDTYYKWVRGEDLSEEEVYYGSSLLGTPTRKLEVFLSRFNDVIGKLIEERCSGAHGYRICIYTWSRWAYKRYFPASLDAAGTIIVYENDVPHLASYPLHRAYDSDVRGVEVPSGEPIATPRIDGWQVNLYFDPILDKPMLSTRYALHNMVFEGRQLKVYSYGEIANPTVKAADYVFRVKDTYTAIEAYKGWTLTFMIKTDKPATILKRPPKPWEGEDVDLTLISARMPSGILADPHSLTKISSSLDVPCIFDLKVEVDGIDASRRAVEQVDYPSIFLWFMDRGDKEHPEIYEIKSLYYSDYVSVKGRRDAKSLIVLLTSGIDSILEKVREIVGASIVEETLNALGELEDALKSINPERVRNVLIASGVSNRIAASAYKALREGKIGRALRITAASTLEGFKVEDAPLVLRHIAEALKE